MSATTQQTLPPLVRRRSRGAAGDGAFRLLAAGAALLVLILLGLIALAMFLGGLPALRTFGWHFFVGLDWDPVAKRFAALVPIYGTLVTSAIAMLIAVPMSFGIAVFLTEVAPHWVRGPVAAAIELLAGVPSIIYGMWGLFVFVPFMADHVDPFLDATLGPLPGIGALFSGPPMGIGMHTAGIILAIMVIPFISAVMRDVFMLVPPSLRESAFALGATRWEVVRGVVLPYTRTAVVGGIFLGLGRALGETMAVTFVLGNAHDFSVSLLAPGNSIAAAIANEFTEADSDIYRQSLIALGFLLFVVTFVVLAAAKLMLLRMARREGT
jgi:phosphate transport system permease protein